MAILRQSRLCRNLEEKELLNLMEQEGTVRTYSRGERIFQETDRPDSVYMFTSHTEAVTAYRNRYGA